MSNERVIDAVLFDLDGVIVGSDEYHYRGWKQLSDDEGWDFDQTLNHQLRGVSRMASLQVILDHNGVNASDAEKQEYADRKNRYYRDSLGDMNESDYIPGAQDLMDGLEEAGIPMAICSSSRNAPFILDVLGIADRFQTVISGHDIEKAKPDPQIFLLAAERMEITPARCVVFEDAESGIQAAKNAGMFSVGVGSADHLPSASVVVADLTEVTVQNLLLEAKP